VRAEARVVQQDSADRGLILKYFFDRWASLYRLVLLFISAERRIFAPNNFICQPGSWGHRGEVGCRNGHDSAHNTRMPPDGERPDDLSLAAHAQNSAVFGEQHRVTRGLAELNDGLQ
jgi:hypothetical protein